MDGLLRQIVSNLSSIILALLLAVAVWVAATLQADPFTEREFAGVTVEPINQPENTVFFEGETARVDITVHAAESVLSELTPADFRATMDLATVTVGERSTVPISVTIDIEAARIEDYAPESQVVQLEAVDTITVPIEVRVEGDVATGYEATLPIVRPEFATIEGPVPSLNEVFSMTGTINVDGVRSDISRKVTITPRDEEGTVVASVIWEPEQADVSVGVQRKAGFKPDVLVVPDLRGDPAPGYRRASVSVEPSTVTLAGPRSLLDDLPGFVRTLPISVTGITEDLVRSTAITVPVGVVVAEGSYVTVTVEILPVLSSRTFTSPVEIQGLRQGWVATLSPNSVEIIIAGPDARLSELAAADVQVFVNLFDYPLGIHRVQPVSLVPEGLEVVSILPDTIEVEIELPATPTSPAGLGGEGE